MTSTAMLRPVGAAPSRHAALASALRAVGDRWTMLVVASLIEGAKRFGELEQELAGIAPNVLSDRLRRLERETLVVARPYSTRPPRFLYELSTAGAELVDALRLLAAWGARRSGEAPAPAHPVCGTALGVRWWCPTCEQVVDEGDDEELHFA